MKPSNSLLAFVPVLLLALITGCSTFSQFALGFGALFGKTKPDYDALEADRERARSSDVSSDPELASLKTTYWTGFRGPRRDGVYGEQPILTDWPEEGPRLLWREPIGGGYASLAVAEGVAFTIEQRRDREAVTAYDVATGRELWVHDYEASFSEPFSGEGPRATPVYHDGKVYSLGARGRVLCLEAQTGSLVWTRDVLEDTGADVLGYGLAASPLVVDDKLIVSSGEPRDEGSSVVAYDTGSGDIVWTALSDTQAYASPMLVELAGRRQILICTADRAVGLEPKDGSLMWEHPWRVFQGISAAQPVVTGPDRVLLSGSYGKGAAMLEIQARGDSFEVRTLWENKRLKNKHNSSVYHDGHVYGLDEGILVCLNTESGERRWKAGHYGYGQVLLAGDKLLVLGGDGVLALVKASPDSYEELGRFQALDGTTWTVPALSGGLLIIRNAAEMACYDLRVGGGAAVAP